MKWFGRAESSNVEDRRGMGGGRLALGGAAGLIIALISLFTGVDLTQITSPSDPNPPAQSRAVNPAEGSVAAFTKVVFRDTEIVWTDLLRREGKEYPEPTLVLFSGAVRSACGTASSAVGPFYCPNDSRVFIDLAFYQDMDRKLNAKGDFARAYVIAHEVGHHVQRLMGYKRRGASDSVAMELQADFLAGVWAHHAEKKFHYLEDGDLEEALTAAYQVGDDTLQKKTQGYVVPDSFTHGTSKQRSFWFKRGFETGDLAQIAGPFERPDIAE